MKQFPIDPLSTEEQIYLQTNLLNTLEQAIAAIDKSGRIVFWNRFAETFYGWTREEALNRNIIEVIATPLLLDSIFEKLEKLPFHEDWSEEFLIQRRNGTTFSAQLTVFFNQSKQRTLISIVGNSHDSKEHNQLQEANQLLAEASALLIDAVDYEAPLSALAQLAVPKIADWCAVHLLQPDGSIEQVALAPVEMKEMQNIHNWIKIHLPKDDTVGLPAVLRSGKPKLVSDVSLDIWAAEAAIKSYMIVPLIQLPQTFGAITFVAAESGRHFDQMSLALAENLASHIAIYLDKVRLFAESQHLNSVLEQRVNERTAELSTAITQLKQSEATIQTLFRISNKLNATMDVDTILDELAQEAIQIVNGERGFAGLRTNDGMTVRKYFRKGVAVSYEYSWPLGEGIPGWVLKYKIPYGTSDAANDPVILHKLAINRDVRSIICTPILDSVGEVLGFFDISNKQEGEGFTIDDQEMLMALAPVASIAIQNALAYQQRLAAEVVLKESYERLRALAANLESVREEERTQIARELHDQLGQALTAMKFDLAILTDRLGQKDTTLAQKTKTLTAQMDTMIKTVRRISTELRPGMLDDLGLTASIEWQARDFEKRTGIVCVVTVSRDDLPLPRPQSLAIFRIFQESLTNVARHASAQYIEVKLTTTPQLLSLEVHDDGRGIKKNEIAGSHSLGLLGMRERAKHLGGTFDIQAVPGDGTIVTVSIPVKQDE